MRAAAAAYSARSRGPGVTPTPQLRRRRFRLHAIVEAPQNIAGRIGRRALCPSALRELEAAARLGLAVLLALHHARIAGEEAAVLEHGAQVGLMPHQRLGESVPHGAGLAG